MPDDGAVTPLIVDVKARWDDADRNGHVNNAAYLALIRAAHDDAARHAPEGALPPAGDWRALEITYRAPVPPGALIRVEVRALEGDAAQRRVRYLLSSEGVPVADATATWTNAGPAAPLLVPDVGDVGGRPFAFQQTVRTYDVGADGTTRPQAIVQWLEHAVFRAAAVAGWPTDRMMAADFVPLVIGHHLVLGDALFEGGVATVTSRLVELRRASGIWLHEVRRATGELVAADHTRGAFVDLGGRLRAAPREMLDDLLRGEPPGTATET